MKIKVRYTNPDCKITRDGNMYDLYTAKRCILSGPKIKGDRVIFENELVPLGIAMELPKYFEANVVSRSSLFGKMKVTLANSIGIIDGPDKATKGYIGNNDIWMANFIAFDDVIIDAGTKVCQFRIRPTMDAPIWTKLKWLFTWKIKFIEVDLLHNKDRGGYGTSGGYKK